MMKMIKNFSKTSKFAALITLLSITSCSKGDYTLNTLPEYNSNYIVLKVSDVELVDKSDYMQNDITLSQATSDAKQALFALAEERLRASGQNGKLYFIVNEASIKQKTTSSDDDEELFDMFSNKVTRYDGKYLVTIILEDHTAGNKKQLKSVITASSTRTIEGSYSAAEKEKILNEVKQELLSNIEKQIENQMMSSFGGYTIAKSK